MSSFVLFVLTQKETKKVKAVKLKLKSIRIAKIF